MSAKLLNVSHCLSQSVYFKLNTLLSHDRDDAGIFLYLILDEQLHDAIFTKQMCTECYELHTYTPTLDVERPHHKAFQN